jgi:ribosomal protein S30
MTSLAHFARIIPVLLLALGLSACSAIKLGYGTLPQVAYWWLDGFVDFDETQAGQVRQELGNLHDWHRRNELPRLIEVLERVERMVAADVSAEQACQVVSEVQLRMAAVAERAAPAVGALATTFTPEQLRHLERKYRQRNAKYTSEWIKRSPAERHEKRYEMMLDRIEMIYGSLDAGQRALLRAAVERSIYDPERVLAEFRRRQQDTLQALRQASAPGTSPEQASALLRATMHRVQNPADAAYRAWQQELVQEGCRTFAAVHQSTTPAQREQAARRLRAYQRDLRDLSSAQRL